MTLHASQAITTRYLPPTNRMGARIKATAAAGSIILPFDPALSTEDNHAETAEALANKWGWGGNWFIGGMPDDTGYCFVCSNGLDTLAFTTPRDTDRTRSDDGTDGQDRESYSDHQDRDSYST